MFSKDDFLEIPSRLTDDKEEQLLTIKAKLQRLLHPFAEQFSGDHSSTGLEVFLESAGQSVDDTPEAVNISSSDPYLVNTDYLQEFVEKCKLRTNVSLLNGRPLFRAPIPEEKNYLKLRARQNRAWAVSSVESGIEFSRKNQLERALKAYQHAIDIDPTFCESYIAMGACLSNAGRHEKAIEMFEKGLEIDPQHKNGYDFLMNALDKLGRRLDYSRNSAFYQKLLQKRRGPSFSEPKSREPAAEGRHSRQSNRRRDSRSVSVYSSASSGRSRTHSREYRHSSRHRYRSRSRSRSQRSPTRSQGRTTDYRSRYEKYQPKEKQSYHPSNGQKQRSRSRSQSMERRMRRGDRSRTPPRKRYRDRDYYEREKSNVDKKHSIRDNDDRYRRDATSRQDSHRKAADATEQKTDNI